MSIPTEPADQRTQPIAPVQPERSSGLAVSGKALVIGVVVVLLAATGTLAALLTHPKHAPAHTPTTFTMVGSLTLTAEGSGVLANGECTSTSIGYQDIRAGAQVTVYDAGGKVVGTGELDTGSPLADGSETYAEPCQFPFTVTGIPTGARFYQVEVSHRGKLTETEADMKSGAVALTLG